MNFRPIITAVYVNSERGEQLIPLVGANISSRSVSSCIINQREIPYESMTARFTTPHTSAEPAVGLPIDVRLVG
ncbi:unnamed protein product [Nippostrongylus brasiliensis]|uniref:Uncharacterized protein n=1 Tax=Nippostrongylus brasiliensis TaxID=27835 RepID=A0A0N4YBF5_NIPBR|nr:unnamed protein product [Nippostrongylus brasiliensis]